MKNQILELSMNRSNNGSINIQIEDQVSGDRLLTGSMSLEAFAQMITGLGNQTFEAELYDARNFGMERETRYVEVDVSNIGLSAKDEIYARVLADFHEKYAEDGWKMVRDGLTSQQRTVGKHEYVIKRYVEV